MILVCVAMKSEADAILAFYPFKTINETLFHYQYHSKHILLTITGIGKVQAAHQLVKTLATYPVDRIYNIGLAGATKPFVQGDVLCIKSASYHDFDLRVFGYQKGEVPGMPLPFESDEHLFNKALDYQFIKQAHLYTGDTFMIEPLKKAYAADMEGAALYHIAYLEKKPILAIKVISDVIGRDAQIDAYQTFEEDGAHRLLNIFQKVIVEG